MEEKLLFCCPKCRGELISNGNNAKCENSHSYDKSRYGYYNLLLSNVGGVHGDNRNMVLARRAFLGSGYYAPLQKRLTELALENTPTYGRVLDIGCGEGYYTDAVERALYERDGDSRVLAFDISKDAVRELHKKNNRIGLAVAGAYDMPVADGTINTAINAFSPFAREEILRSLTPDGVFIMAIPEEMHLFELKEILYKTPYKNQVKDSLVEGFELISDERVTFTMELCSAEDIRALFGMTPYAYRTPVEAARILDTLEELSVTADFHLYVYRKK